MKKYLIAWGMLAVFAGACQLPLPRIDPFPSDPNAGFVCGDSVWVDIRDGQTYRTVFIGGKCWFAQNLNFGEKVNEGTGLTDEQLIEKHCHEDSDSLCHKYGGLYTLEEALQGVPRYPNGAAIPPMDDFPIQGVCPDGWHIPSDEEWMALERDLGMANFDTLNTINAYRGGSVDAGEKLKHPIEGQCFIPTDQSCGLTRFDALLAGNFLSDTIYLPLSLRASQYWSSTPFHSSGEAYIVRFISGEFRGVGRYSY
ncbi:MAG: FISUMP domain-containing protein, partial [Bacteroidota bacterium]